jgi:hypothetical protein
MLLVNFVPAYFDQAHDLCVVVELAHASAIRVRDGARGRRAGRRRQRDRYEAPYEANLFDMNAKYADVMSEQEALDYIASQKLNATAGAVPSKASR